MFKWLFTKFKKKEPEVASDIPLKVILEQPRIKIKQNIEPVKEEPPKQIKKEIVMDYHEQLRNIWLVVVDTTGLVKATRSYNEATGEGGDDMVDAKKLGPLGIKTFAFVNAPDLNAAKGLLWRTLGAKNPAIRRFLPEIARATKATNFTQIFPILTRTGVVWNYVGAKNEALPGQQSAIQKGELVGKNQYGEESARDYEPAVPSIPDGGETKVSKSDVGQMTAADRKILESQGQMPQVNGNMTPQQMMQMMQMMMTMMQNGGQMAPPTPPRATYTERSQSADELSAEDLASIDQNIQPLAPEETDPDLQRQIESLRERGNSAQVNIDLDEQLDQSELERMAKMTEQINFKKSEEEAPTRGKGKRRVAPDA